MEVDNESTKVNSAEAEASVRAITGSEGGIRVLDQGEVRSILLEGEDGGESRSQERPEDPILTRIRRRTRELEVLVEEASSGRLASNGRTYFEGAEDLSPAEHDAAVELYRARRGRGATPNSAIDVDREDDDSESTAGIDLSSPPRERVAVARLVTPGDLEEEEARCEQRWGELHNSAEEAGLADAGRHIRDHIGRVRRRRQI